MRTTISTLKLYDLGAVQPVQRRGAAACVLVAEAGVSSRWAGYASRCKPANCKASAGEIPVRVGRAKAFFFLKKSLAGPKADRLFSLPFRHSRRQAS